MSAQTDVLQQSIRSTELQLDAYHDELAQARQALATLEEARGAVLTERFAFRDHLALQRRRVASIGTVENVNVATAMQARWQEAFGSNMENGIESQFSEYLGNIDACIDKAHEKIFEIQQRLDAAEALLSQQQGELRDELRREADESQAAQEGRA